LPEARQRTFDLVADLSDAQLMGPRLAIVNPLHWEIGHVAWFQEHWVLRHRLGEPAIRGDGDALYDSSAIAHDTRWDLPLPSRSATLGSRTNARDRLLYRRRRHRGGDPSSPPLHPSSHEDTPAEPFPPPRQPLGYPPPRLPVTRPLAGAGPRPGDAEVPGGAF